MGRLSRGRLGGGGQRLGGGADVIIETQPDPGPDRPTRAVDDSRSPSQIQSERVGRLRAGRGILRQRAHHQIRHRGRHPNRRRRKNIKVMMDKRRGRQRRIKRRRPGQQLIQQHPQGVQIGGRAQPATEDLFGGHIPRSTDNRARGSRRSLHDFRDTEVGDFQQAGGVEQNVVRFDVTVQHPPAMRTGQRRSHRQPHRTRRLRRHTRPPTGQRPPAQQLHHDQMQIVCGDRVIDPDDMRMVQGCE